MGIAEPVPVPIPTNLGLSTAIPESELAAGQLLVARNKAPEKWGPRHGMTLLDRVTRGRGVALFNGTSSEVRVPYSPAQCDLGTKWTCTFYFKAGAIGTERALFSLGTSVKGSIFAKLQTTGNIYIEVQDTSTTVSLTSVSTISANDEVLLHLVREGSSLKMFVGRAGNVVLESASSGVLSPTQSNLILAEDIIIGSPNGSDSASHFNGWFGALYLLSYPYTLFKNAFNEMPCPRSVGVLLALAGELIESDTLVEDASRMQNHATCSNIVGSTRFLGVHEPVQAITHHTSIDGRERNVVVAGGKLYGEIV